MNLSKQELEELNTLLKDVKLDLPRFRQEVSRTGTNYTWLQKHIQIRNKELAPRLKELLDI